MLRFYQNSSSELSVSSVSNKIEYYYQQCNAYIIMNVYHYTQIKNILSITEGDPKASIYRNGEWINESPPGLRPLRYEGMHNKTLKGKMAIYCLLNPQPREWLENKHFDGIWNRLDNNEVLLTLNIDPDNLNIHIADAGHIVGFDYRQTYPNIPSKYIHPDIVTAEDEYAKSRITLKEYLNSSDTPDYSLPELLIEEKVPLDHIHIDTFQPELEKGIGSYHGETRRQFINRISKIPELNEWVKTSLEKLEARHESGLPDRLS